MHEPRSKNASAFLNKNFIEEKTRKSKIQKSFGFSLFTMGFLKDFCFVS